MRKSSGLLFLLIVILIVVGPWSLHAAPPSQETTPIIIDQPDAAATVYWTEPADGMINNGNADGSGSASTCKSNEANPRGLVVSAETGRIYWVERDAGRLRRANLDCSGAKTIGPKLIDPDRLALDVEGGKIYWTENQSDTTTSNRIRRANLDGTGAETILTGLNAPVGIAVDHANDYLYWTEYGGDSIWRSSLTGANKQQILKLGKGAAPLEIALDVEGNRIYWLSPSSGGIFSATLNGENAGLWLAADTPRSMAIDISAGKLYWADQGSKEIRRINLDGTGNQLLYNSADGVDRPLGVGLLITAAPSCYTLTRTHTGNGGDPTATPNKSSGCDAGKYIAGESITLTAASDDGWRVKNWSGTNNDASTSTTNTVTMPAANHVVSVTYEQIPQPCYSLSRTHTGSGADPVASPPFSSGCGTGQYKAGESITLTADPADGWRVKNWSGTNNDAGTSTTNTVTMPAANHVVQVNYESILPPSGGRALIPLAVNIPYCFSGREVESNNLDVTANGPICPGSLVSGLPNDEFDFFKFQAGADGAISIEVTGYSGKDAQLVLYYQAVVPDKHVDADTSSADGLRIDYTGKAGLYYVLVYFATPKPAETQPYTMTLSFP